MRQPHPWRNVDHILSLNHSRFDLAHTGSSDSLAEPDEWGDGRAVSKFLRGKFLGFTIGETVFFYSFFSPPCKNAQKVPHKIVTVGASIPCHRLGCRLSAICKLVN